MPRERARAVPASREEVEGFLEGLRALAVRRRREGRPEPEAERLVDSASTALRDGRIEAAERNLLDAERRFADQEPEVELLEYPRGLVGYVPSGERGAPPAREEEQLSNRLLLIQRLLQVRRSEGRDVEALVRRLNEAEDAYRRGDRARARAVVDAVQDELDRSEGGARERSEP